MPNVGYRHSEESKRKISEALRGKSRNAREKNHRWNGGRQNHHGYVLVLVGSDHPMADSKGRVREHRLVMAGMVGRYLTADETVHHLNGDKKDNRPENLQLRKGPHGGGSSYLCGDCGSINVLSVGI